MKLLVGARVGADVAMRVQVAGDMACSDWRQVKLMRIEQKNPNIPKSYIEIDS